MSKPIDEKRSSRVSKMVEELLSQIHFELPKGFGRDQRPNRQLSATRHTTSRVQGRDLQTLNENELKSVYALLAYVAHNENIRQETVEAIVEANFHVNHVSRITQKDYEDVIRFLVDLRIDEMRN